MGTEGLREGRVLSWEVSSLFGKKKKKAQAAITEPNLLCWGWFDQVMFWIVWSVVLVVWEWSYVGLSSTMCHGIHADDPVSLSQDLGRKAATKLCRTITYQKIRSPWQASGLSEWIQRAGWVHEALTILKNDTRKTPSIQKHWLIKPEKYKKNYLFQSHLLLLFAFSSAQAYFWL